jgi:sirohydrochlorin cobaltochelatase
MDAAALQPPGMSRALLIVGHGAPPKDYPADKVRRLKMLEARRRKELTSMSPEEYELDTEVRTWLRTPESDPYQVGIEALANAMRTQTVVPVHVCYNEFCGPSLEGALTTLVERGVTHICVLPTMFTPGGVHSELEIPEALAEARVRYPSVQIDYTWPFDLAKIARLMLAHAEPHMI